MRLTPAGVAPQAGMSAEAQQRARELASQARLRLRMVLIMPTLAYGRTGIVDNPWPKAARSSAANVRGTSRQGKCPPRCKTFQ